MRWRVGPQSGLFVVVLAVFILAMGFSIGLVARHYGLGASAAVLVVVGAVAFLLRRGALRR